MEQKVQDTKFPADRWHTEPAVFVALIDDLVTFALWACKLTAIHFSRKDDIVPNITTKLSRPQSGVAFVAKWSEATATKGAQLCGSVGANCVRPAWA